MDKQSFYTVGGTVQAGDGLYIPRKADEELLELCREGTFAYVLTSRQMGKSSLMERTAEQLENEGIRSVIIDLTQIGIQVTAEEWYLGLLTTIGDYLMLEADVVGWWQDHAHLGFTQRMTQFFQEVLLAEVETRVVIFVDEIDSTLSLGFTDDFYAAIRYIHNARAHVPEFRRLSFVLVGVATPSDLISDPNRTPFNIGQRVDLTDFTFEEAIPLTEGLGLPDDEAKQVLRWVLRWTGGHPYLTQRLCRVIAEKERNRAEQQAQFAAQHRNSWSEADVDNAVASTFFGEKSEQDNNLQFVRDMLTKRAPDSVSVLATYWEIRRGRRSVRDEEQSVVKSHLKLSGVVHREKDKLRVRNPIYGEVFDLRWVKEHWSVSWWKRIPLEAKFKLLIVSLFIVLVLLAMVAKSQQQLAQSRLQLARQTEISAKKSKNFAKQQQYLRKLADERAAEAEKAKTEAVSAQQTAEKERNRAEEQAQLAAKRAAEAEKAKAEAVTAQNTAESERNQAEQQAHIATSHRLTAQALSLLVSQFDRALLLSLEAYRIDHNVEAQSSLLTGLQHNPHLNAFLHGHQGYVESVAFSPDGKRLASGSWDKTLRLWDVNLDSWVKTPPAKLYLLYAGFTWLNRHQVLWIQRLFMSAKGVLTQESTLSPGRPAPATLPIATSPARSGKSSWGTNRIAKRARICRCPRNRLEGSLPPVLEDPSGIPGQGGSDGRKLQNEPCSRDQTRGGSSLTCYRALAINRSCDSESHRHERELTHGKDR